MIDHRRRASIVRRATEKSIAKEKPRPTGPVTNQARALSSDDMGLLPAFQDLLLQPLPLTGRDRPLRPALVELDPPLECQVKQTLLLDPLSRPLEEEPGEQAEAEERPLDHHHDAGGALVGDRRDVPVPLSRRV